MAAPPFGPSTVAVLLLAPCLVGCASTAGVAYPPLHDQVTRVKRVVLLPPDTRVFTQEFASGRLVEDWSLAARHLVAEAVTARFAADGRFVMVPLESDAPPSALEEREHARRAFARSAETRIAGGGQGPPVCTPGTVSTGREGIDADAWLLVYAFDQVPTSGYVAGQVGAGILAVGLTAGMALGAGAGGGPGAVVPPFAAGSGQDVGPRAFAMCLVDARTGETLWFDARRSGFDLRDRGSVEAVVADLYGSLTRPAR